MKKLSLFLFIIFLMTSLWSLNILKKPEIKHKSPLRDDHLVSYIYSLADSLTYDFIETYKAEYSYQDASLESILVKQNIEDNWLEIENYIYTYQEDRILQEIYQIYDNGWINYQQENYTYNEEDLILTYQQDFWSNDTWQPYLHIDYIYDNEGFLINEEWTYFSSAKEIDAIYDVAYEYDSQGRVEVETWTYSTDDVNWNNYIKGIYQRNDSGSIIHEDWQSWSETTWLSYLQYNHTYDTNGLIDYTEGITFADNQWQYYDNYQYYYNDNLNTSQLISKLWDNENQIWNNSYKYDYNYEEVVNNSDNDVIANDFMVSLYPNPFIDEINFSSKNLIEKVSIYNIKGQKIYSSQVNSSKASNLKLTNFPSGIYLFKFENSLGEVTVIKQIKIK